MKNTRKITGKYALEWAAATGEQLQWAAFNPLDIDNEKDDDRVTLDEARIIAETDPDQIFCNSEVASILDAYGAFITETKIVRVAPDKTRVRVAMTQNINAGYRLENAMAQISRRFEWTEEGGVAENGEPIEYFDIYVR